MEQRYFQMQDNVMFIWIHVQLTCHLLQICIICSLQFPHSWVGIWINVLCIYFGVTCLKAWCTCIWNEISAGFIWSVHKNFPFFSNHKTKYGPTSHLIFDYLIICKPFLFLPSICTSWSNHSFQFHNLSFKFTLLFY